MSQYPYQPPQPPTSYGYGYYPQDPMAALLAPARRASVIMFILGGLLLPCGALLPFAATKVDPSQLPPQQAAEYQQQYQQLEQQLTNVGWSVTQFYVLVGTCLSVPGIVLLILGGVVRRGGMGGVVTSILFCGLIVLGVGLMLLASLAQGGIVQAGVALLLLIGLVTALVFLFQAAGRAGQVAAYRVGMAVYGQQYPQGYGQAPQGPIYPSQQPQTWQQPGVGPWGQGQAGWGQQNPPVPPPPPPPSSDREG